MQIITRFSVALCLTLALVAPARALPIPVTDAFNWNPPAALNDIFTGYLALGTVNPFVPGVVALLPQDPLYIATPGTDTLQQPVHFAPIDPLQPEDPVFFSFLGSGRDSFEPPH